MNRGANLETRSGCFSAMADSSRALGPSPEGLAAPCLLSSPMLSGYTRRTRMGAKIPLGEVST
jgi:hypothetical protein